MLLKLPDTDSIQYNPRIRLELQKKRAMFSEETDSDLEMSEKSYPPLFTTEEFLESVINLNFNLTWIFITVLANMVLYFFITYEMAFKHGRVLSLFEINMVKVSANIVIIVDAIGLLMFCCRTEMHIRTAYRGINKWAIYFYLLSLLCVPLHIARIFSSNSHLSIVTLCLVCLRFWKIFIYVRLMNNLPGQISLRNLYKKYFIVWAMIVHSLACVWMLIGCNESIEICNSKYKGNLTYWNGVIYFKDKYNFRSAKITPFELYWISVNYVLGGLTSLGYLGASKRNAMEELICVFIMFLHVWLVYCLLNADFIMCIIHTKSFDGQVVNRLQAMEQDLIRQQGVSNTMKKRVIGYYKEFFLRDKAVKYATLMTVVPDPFVNETKTEIFWNAMKKCKIFQRTSEAFKRAVMRNMELEAFSRGDILFDLGKMADEMCFVARGNVYILSGEDGDSPIVTLGQGSLIGQINLLYSKTTKFKVVVATYSVIYTLHKKDFWGTIYRYRKLMEGPKVHASFRKHIKHARRLMRRSVQKAGVSIVRKWKCLESKKILSEFKEKIKRETEKTSKVRATIETYRKLYTYSEIHNQKSYDDLFLRTSWPWILRPNSQLLVYWSRFVLITIFYVAIRYPYLVAYNHTDVLNKSVSTQAVFLVYLCDVLIQIFTAIESRTETIWHVSDILSARMEKLNFIMDIAASIPFHLYPIFTYPNKRFDRVFTFVCLNRLLKLYKVDVIIREFEKTTKLHIVIVKAVKSVLYVSYLGYIGGALYYTVSCFESPECYPNSWISRLKQLFQQYPDLYDPKFHNPMNFIPTISFQDILSVVSNNCPCLTTSLLESILQSILSVLGILLINFLFSDYTAGLTLKYNSVMEYLEFFEATKRFMTCIDMPKYLQTRVFNQLKTSWRINEGVQRGQLYIDCPERLYNTLQIAINTKSLESIPLFQEIEEDILNLVATRCTELNLPPREYLIYSGEQARNMYVILKGFCTIIEGTVVKKVLGPGSFVNGMEVFLGLPSMMTICASTYAKILKLNTQDLKYVCAKFPEFYRVVKQSADEEAISRVFYRIGQYTEFYHKHHHSLDEMEQSFFIFPTYHRHPLNIDYKRVYNASGWKIVRYILLRRTILPYGKFIRNWEIFKAISAFILALITPAEWVLLYYAPNMAYVCYFLYAIGVVDMYMRLHVCYYNEKGILVTHPKYTAKYYLTHAFLLDFMGTFPIALVLTKLGSLESSRMVILLNCNVILQMYRFPEAFSYTYQLIYKTHDVLFQAARCIPFMLVMLNMLACFLVYVSGHVTFSKGRVVMVRNDFSWIELAKSIDHLNTTEPYVFLLVSLYFTTGTFLGINFRQFTVYTKPESIFVICCILLGYICKMYIMVGIVHSRYVGNQKLTVHRNHMVQLVDYLKEENLPKKLQTKVIEHFIQTWKITYGFHTRAILSVFHLPLKTDFYLHTYLNTLQKVVVFEEASTNFFRHIGRHLYEIYLKKDQDVIRVNDIVKVIYIVHKGEVTIYGPTDEVFAILRRGSMFGNIDEIDCTRSMIRARTSTTTDLFVVRTGEYYTVLKSGYNFIYRKMHNFLLLHNLSYIKSSEDSSESYVDFSVTVTLSLVNKLISSKWYSFGMVLSEVSACILSSYQVAFEPFEIIFYILYLLDMVHIAEVVLSFYIPYEDNRGDLVTDLKKIRKRYMKPMKFYLDALTLFPYEMLCLLFTGQKRQDYRRCLGAARTIRAVNVYHYFSGYSFLSNTVIWIRLSLNLTYTLVLVHLGACIFYIMACPWGRCQVNNWTDIRGDYQCGHEYLCSIYIMMSIVSSTAYSERRLPRSLGGMGNFIVLGIVSQFLLVLLLGDLTALVRNSVYNLTKYDFEVKEFLTHLSNSFVSVPFLEKMKKYCYKLWVIGKGRQIPTILLSSPNYLMEEIKVHAYGSHITNNVVFAKCHPDFIRTVIRKLKVQKFFVGDTICHQEDINNTMYFIHKGIVDVYSVTETEEVHVDTLQELDCFGVIQGLFPDTPHTHTFKSNASSTILFLTYNEWSVLLKFFPASKFEIYLNLQNIDKSYT